MIKLEITVQPKHFKYLEFSQTLASIAGDLKQLCPGLLITEQNASFTMSAEVNSTDQLTRLLSSSELIILSGAIRTLAETSEVIIQGIGYKKKGSDLREIRLNYFKKGKTSFKTIKI